MKQFTSESIMSLREALTLIYWKRKDLKTFIYHTIDNNDIVTAIDFENSTKEETVALLIERMLQRQSVYHDDILKLFNAVLHFKDFSHLRKWDDGEAKIKNAQNAVEALKKHASGYFQLEEEKKLAENRKRANEIMQREKEVARQKLVLLKDSFLKLAAMKKPTERGYAFELFLNDLFKYYDLDPRHSFKIIGEQIDGAFTFENTDYILEAKWQSSLINAGDLYKFAGKVSGKLKNTIGLFISFNGFSLESQETQAPGLKSMILMDGNDLMAVLEERIELNDLIYRKRRHASETGNIYLKANDII